MSWYSQLVTNTSSRINNLQRTLLASENDGDTEDDTNVCRVLRAYYTEKGRMFPPWLPPDPKAPPPQAPVFQQQQQVGSRYGGMTAPGGGGGQLSSLWDNNPAAQRQDPQSLRQARGVPSGGNAGNPQQSSRNPFSNRNLDSRDDPQARPLPSQRAGSYQQQQQYGRNNSDTSTLSAASAAPSGGGGGGSAQDRLKQRLWGGARTVSPSTGGPFQPPAQPAQPASGPRWGSVGGGGAQSGGDYEDRFAPGGTYDNARSQGGDKPFMAANAPWASNEYEFSGGGGGGGGSSGRTGLPSGPRRGLPSGPRMR